MTRPWKRWKTKDRFPPLPPPALPTFPPPRLFCLFRQKQRQRGSLKLKADRSRATESGQVHVLPTRERRRMPMANSSARPPPALSLIQLEIAIDGDRPDPYNLPCTCVPRPGYSDLLARHAREEPRRHRVETVDSQVVEGRSSMKACPTFKCSVRISGCGFFGKKTCVIGLLAHRRTGPVMTIARAEIATQR